LESILFKRKEKKDKISFWGNNITSKRECCYTRKLSFYSPVILLLDIRRKFMLDK